MTRVLRLVAATLLLAVPAFAAIAQADDETKFNQSQAERLDKFAKTAFQKGFPRQARLIWLQVLKLYDPEDQEAHERLGHVKVGNSWAPDSKFVYPIEDTGSGADGVSLRRAYDKLREELASAHKRQAQTWEKAGRVDKSSHHWQMVLRWDKTDVQAQKALEHHEIGGVTGTDLEQTLYDRSKAIERAVDEQSKVVYPVELVKAENPVLDQAQVQYVSAQSEHFLLHGDPGQEEHLKEALQWAERARCIVAVAFPWHADVHGKWGFFVGDETYKQILRAHANQLSDLEWRLEHTKTCGIGDTLVGATGSVQTLYDAVVRQVARAHAGFRADALVEGIGHTFVGMIFNNNRLFGVDLKKQQGTVATEEDREYTSPNFDVWKNLALEMAWKMTGGVSAVDLVLAETASFTNEQRIKAWSFCDYVVRRDPELLRKFDQVAMQMRQTQRRRPVDVEEKFTAATEGVTLAQLDKEWEDFWTEATPVLAAIRNNTPPLQAISPGVEKWLQAFNEVRKENNAAPVTWSSNLSTRCYEHANYLKANKDERGPEAEHRELVDKGGSHLGGMFAQMAIVDTDARMGQAKKTIEEWMRIPGYRDALVHDFLRSVGIYSDGSILVMDVVAGLGTPKSKRAGYLCWPWKNSKGIPAEVEVAAIGPELQELLEKHGQGKRKVVGYPLTLHFGQNVIGDRNSYRCNVVDARGRKVEGAILLDGGKIRRSTAPGMVTFYPFEPLPRGAIGVQWTWEQDGRVQTVEAGFHTK